MVRMHSNIVAIYRAICTCRTCRVAEHGRVGCQRDRAIGFFISALQLITVSGNSPTLRNVPATDVLQQLICPNPNPISSLSCMSDEVNACAQQTCAQPKSLPSKELYTRWRG